MAYAIEIGRALECAHAHMLVHRDVKPQNVLIDPDGRAKVTDFGIARSLEAQGLTATGRVLGTTDYVSPEQALGHDVTEQSDIYSLGIVLYEMLTGEAPFKADTQVAVAMKHVREPLPDVQRRRPRSRPRSPPWSSARPPRRPRTATPPSRRWCTTSRRCWPSRRPAAARPPARPPPSCARCPTTRPDFAPQRLRHPRRTLFSVAALAIVAAVIAVLATRTEKGPGQAATPSSPGLSAVTLSKDAANDYDPEGDGQESPSQVQFAIDGLPTTVWNTETYEGGFEGSNKSGVGLYVNAGTRVAARQMDVVTSTPGFTAAVYASDSVPEPPPGLGRGERHATVKREQTIQLDTASRGFRNYLLWITELPEGGQDRDQGARSEALGGGSGTCALRRGAPAPAPAAGPAARRRAPRSPPTASRTRSWP